MLNLHIGLGARDFFGLTKRPNGFQTFVRNQIRIIQQFILDQRGPLVSSTEYHLYSGSSR